MINHHSYPFFRNPGFPALVYFSWLTPITNIGVLSWRCSYFPVVEKNRVLSSTVLGWSRDDDFLASTLQVLGCLLLQLRGQKEKFKNLGRTHGIVIQSKRLYCGLLNFDVCQYYNWFFNKFGRTSLPTPTMSQHIIKLPSPASYRTK